MTTGGFSVLPPNPLSDVESGAPGSSFCLSDHRNAAVGGSACEDIQSLPFTASHVFSLSFIVFSLSSHLTLISPQIHSVRLFPFNILNISFESKIVIIEAVKRDVLRVNPSFFLLKVPFLQTFRWSLTSCFMFQFYIVSRGGFTFCLFVSLLNSLHKLFFNTDRLDTLIYLKTNFSKTFLRTESLSGSR